MKKKSIFALIVTILLCLQVFGAMAYAAAYSKPVSKIQKYDLEYKTKDNYIIRSTLTSQSKNPERTLAVLLHSLGSSSENWGALESDLLNAGFDVLKIDLRGHGKSVYLVNAKTRSWLYLSDTIIAQYPNDVYQIIKTTPQAAKNWQTGNIVFVGADIGANTAVLTTKMLPAKPKALVLITPRVTFRGLYIPVALAESGKIPILAIAAEKDFDSLRQIENVKKYSQSTFDIKTFTYGGPGMSVIKFNPEVTQNITEWLVETTQKK